MWNIVVTIKEYQHLFVEMLNQRITDYIKSRVMCCSMGFTTLDLDINYLHAAW